MGRCDVTRPIDIILMEMYIKGMTKTQVQLPDELYRRAKKLAQARQVSLAELVREGLEYVLSTDSASEQTAAEWQPPEARWLGWRGPATARLKEEAQRTGSEARLERRRGHQGKANRDALPCPGRRRGTP